MKIKYFENIFQNRMLIEINVWKWRILVEIILEILESLFLNKVVSWNIYI